MTKVTSLLGFLGINLTLLLMGAIMTTNSMIYISWIQNIFKKLKPKLTSDGRIAINIGDGKNGKVPTSSDIMHSLIYNVGYYPMAHIIWNKNNTSNRTAWGSWMSPSSPSYPTPFEHVLLFSNNESGKLCHTGKSDLTKDEFIQYANSLWTFKPENNFNKIGHPAPFPIELPYRIIKMNTYIDDVVFDPFMGSGTTGVVCKMINRNFIGAEIDENYFNIANNRIENTVSKVNLF